MPPVYFKIFIASAALVIFGAAVAIFFTAVRLAPATPATETTETISYLPKITLLEDNSSLPVAAPEPTAVIQSGPKIPNTPKSIISSSPLSAAVKLIPVPKTIQQLQLEAFVSLDCSFDSTTIISRGSGVIVRKDGLILTNRHIATYIDPDFTNRQAQYPTQYCDVGISNSFNRPPEKLYRATLYWAAPETNPQDSTKIAFDYDFAFLKIDKLLYGRSDCLRRYPTSITLCQQYPETLPSSFPAVPVGQANDLKINESITVTGYPSEFSADNKLFQVAGPVKEIYANIIEASAPVEKGFSGSAVLNQYNELVGLLSAGRTGDFADFIRLDWIQNNNQVWK